MADPEISSVNVVVQGGPSSQQVDLNIGPQGVRGTRIFGVDADPRLVTTTLPPQEIILYDILVVTNTDQSDYGVMYQKVNLEERGFVQLIDLKLSGGI